MNELRGLGWSRGFYVIYQPTNYPYLMPTTPTANNDASRAFKRRFGLGVSAMYHSAEAEIALSGWGSWP